MTQVIELFGGPGCGKSTTAAALFAGMKQDGFSVELVREWVKGWAWESRKIGPYDQLYILAKQLKAESVLYNKVDYIIADSPLALCPFYEAKYAKTSIVAAAWNLLEKQTKAAGIMRHRFMLTRFKPYATKGRYETEAQARQIDTEMRGWFKNCTELWCDDEDRVAYIYQSLGLGTENYYTQRLADPDEI